jgi:hypothetical protein
MTTLLLIFLLAVLITLIYSNVNLGAKLNEVKDQLRKISDEQERVKQEAADLTLAKQEAGKAKAAFERKATAMITELKEENASQWIIDIAEAGRRAGLAEIAEQETKSHPE